MMMECPKYKVNELSKMYPTWTKYEVKELTKLGEKLGKTLPNRNKRPNDDVIEHSNKKPASTNLKSKDITLPPLRPIDQKDKVVVELNNDGDSSSIHHQGMYDSKYDILFLIF
jgi:hypothetical protein